MKSIVTWLLSKMNPQQLIDFLAGFVVNIFPGLKSKSLGWLGTIIGIYNIYASPENVAKLCDMGIICLEGNKVWGWVIAGFSFLAMIFAKSKELNLTSNIQIKKK